MRVCSQEIYGVQWLHTLIRYRVFQGVHVWSRAIPKRAW